MSDQLSLLDPVPPPPAGFAKQAAAVLDNLRRLENERDGCTAWDLWVGWSGERTPQQNVIARRLNDLLESKLVVKTGEEREGGYGRSLFVWRSVADA